MRKSIDTKSIAIAMSTNDVRRKKLLRACLSLRSRNRREKSSRGASAFRSCRFRVLVACVALATTLGGCGGKFVHVRAGEDPRYQDDGVRFRTTYYFRVYDACGNSCTEEQMKNGQCRPQSDSLYRYRMTGKAGSLTKVHFESGTLTTQEIEPFGANVVFDDKAGRFRFKSRQQLEEEIARAEKQRDDDVLQRNTYDDIDKLVKLCKMLGAADTSYTATCAAVITGKVSSLGLSPSPVPKDTKPAPQPGDNSGQSTTSAAASPSAASAGSGTQNQQAKTTAAANSSYAAAPSTDKKPAAQKEAGNPTISSACGADNSSRRGFQILGPEGWRTFNQDERLVLALSSSDKPLIATMQEISERVLNQKSNGMDLTLFFHEQTATERARQALDAAAGDDELTDVWKRVQDRMEPKR